MCQCVKYGNLVSGAYDSNYTVSRAVCKGEQGERFLEPRCEPRLCYYLINIVYMKKYEFISYFLSKTT